MLRVEKVASYICDRYLKEYGQKIDEMKLHKLLYFMQRECIVQTSHPMFPETFHAWKYGPVMPQIRAAYKQETLTDLPSPTELSEYKSVLDEVFTRLAGSKSLTLSSLTHGELSWQRARKGYSKYDDSDVEMSLNDIREDAENYKRRQLMLRQWNSIILKR